MLARLGLVLYWVASGLSVLMTGLLIFFGATSEEVIRTSSAIAWVGFAVVIWLMGRAILFVLAGK